MRMSETRMSSARRRPAKGENNLTNGNKNVEHDNKKTRPRGFRRRLGLFATAFLMLMVCIFEMLLLRSTSEPSINVDKRGLRKVSTSTEPPPLMEQQQQHYLDIDFQANNNVADAYRIGDVFANWIDRSALPFYELYYPNTLAHQYLREIPDNAHGHRNLTAFLHVLDRVMAGESQEPPPTYCRDESKKCRKWQHLQNIQTPSDTELVVHLRLGDVLTDPNLNEVDSTMEELWNREEGFLNIGNENQKYNYNKREFLQLIRQIPISERRKMNKCTIVGAGFITDADHANRNEDYKRLVVELLESEIGCTVGTFTSGNPDRDLLYMAFANYFIGAQGGYAQIAAACVTARRGWGHALYSYFNGYAHPFFIDEKTKEYIDWSQVDYHPNTSLMSALDYSWEYATSLSSS